MRQCLKYFSVLAFMTCSKFAWSDGGSKSVNPWNARLQLEIEKIQKEFSGQLGVYVSDVRTGASAGVGQDRPWYLASATKVFVALEVIRQIEQKKFGFDDMILFRSEDRRDGAGETSSHRTGTPLSIRYLLEQMLTESDNAATDMLISKVGLDRVQATVQSLVPEGGIGPITDLLGVRRKAFSHLHPAAEKLSAEDFIRLKETKNQNHKLIMFSSLIGVPVSSLKVRSLKEAFESYYASGLNSGTLIAYSKILSELAQGKLITPFVSKELFAIMVRCKTGQDRIIAGLSPKFTFAHKTGTQLSRICDFGVIKTPHNQILTVAACAEKFRSDRQAARILAKVGAAIRQATTGL